MLYVFVSIVHNIYLSVLKIIHIQWIFVYWIIYLTFSFHLSRHKILRFAVSLIARNFSNTYIYMPSTECLRNFLHFLNMLRSYESFY